MDAAEKPRILVIEDEHHIAEGLKLNLELKGYLVRIAADGMTGLQEWKEWQPDLIVLDIMLPGLDGLSVLRNIRLMDELMPVLILSARGDSEDKVKGFSYGVDDYLSKPFNLEEFLLRVERLLIRARGPDRDPVRNHDGFAETYQFGANRIDFGALTALTRNGEIHLTEQEARLLKFFIANQGRPVSRNKLLEIGCGYARGTQTRTIDNFIVRFRKYFENNPKKPVYFRSLRAVGYVFNHDED
jgi:DNA-binding response OmpR family regulator